MCISAKASLISFFVNLFSCIALVTLGNANLKFYNIMFAILMIFVSFMQIVDFGMWIDLGCTKGYNKLASFLGPILIYLQPLCIFFITYYFINNTELGKRFYNKKLKPQENGIFDHFNIAKGGLNGIKILNIVYFALLIIALVEFYRNAFTTQPDLLCTKVVNGNLSWNWFRHPGLIKIFINIHFLIAINIYAINPESNFLKIGLLVLYTLLFGAKYLKKYNQKEIWCYFVNFGALILLLIQKLVPNQLN